PHAQGEPALGAHLRQRRRASTGATGLSGGLQHDLAHRTAWVSNPRRRPAEPAFIHGTGRVGSNPVSHKSRAVQGFTPGEFKIFIDGLSFWLMRIAREVGHGAAL